MRIQRQKEIPLESNMIGRNLSLTEKEDYKQNIDPLVKQGYQVYSIGEHRYGTYVIFGWKILINPSNRY
jgi:hypothetical protein